MVALAMVSSMNSMPSRRSRRIIGIIKEGFNQINKDKLKIMTTSKLKII